MITQQQAIDAFEYKEGKLYWKYVKSIAIKAGDEAGANDGYGYRVVRFNNKLYRVHHIVYLMFNGVLPKRIDHINQNRSDNRIENLRSCSRSENNYNQGISSRNKSGLKGVSFDKKNKKWRADIMFNSKRYSLGRFATKEEAYAVACKARDKFHGEFARH